MNTPTVVRIVDYDPQWPADYLHERDALLAATGRHAVEFHHIGSTAVPGLAAKPLIDILMAVPRLEDPAQYQAMLQPLGYEIEDVEDPGRFFFWKGAPRIRNLHIAEFDGWHYWRFLLFRDHLAGNPDVAAQYVELKRRLAMRFPTERKAYSEAKSKFVAGVVASALAGRPDLQPRLRPLRQ